MNFPFDLSVVTFHCPNCDFKNRGANLFVTRDFYIVETMTNFYIFDNHFLPWKEIIKGFSGIVQIGIYKDRYLYYCDERDSKVVYVNLQTKQRKATQIALGLFFPCGDKIFGIREENMNDSMKELYSIDLAPEKQILKFQCNESIHHVAYSDGYFCIAGSHRFLFRLDYDTHQCLTGVQLPIDVLEMQIYDHRLIMSAQDGRNVYILNFETFDIEKVFGFQTFSTFFPMQEMIFLKGESDIGLFDGYQNKVFRQEHRGRVKITSGGGRSLMLMGDTFYSIRPKKIYTRSSFSFHDVHFFYK
jgi:hypothetical protein